jgi:cytochrome d ubiquinol oxidase subunit II
MFGSLSLLELQQYWWIIISLLAGILIFLTFVQGGQTMIFCLGKNDTEQKVIINSLGRKWEFTFTTLVTFGGAFFASFPLFYSTSFGGAYWVWMAILFCFIIQAVSYEYRTKPANFLGKKTYDIFLFINGFLGTLLLGTAVGTFFTGSQFSVEKANLTSSINPVISQWQSPWRGLEAVANIQNLALGLTIFFLARTLGLLYFMNNISDKNIFSRAKAKLWYSAIPFTAFFLFFMIRLMFLDGYDYDPDTKIVSLVHGKYLQNIIEMPVNTVLLLLGVASVLFGIIRSLLIPNTKGIWFAGAGTIVTVFCLFILAGFNHTAFYPSTFDPQSSLTIENSSSSHFTLTVMSYVSLAVPFVAFYVFYAWRVMNKTRIDAEELEHDHHAY